MLCGLQVLGLGRTTKGPGIQEKCLLAHTNGLHRVYATVFILTEGLLVRTLRLEGVGIFPLLKRSCMNIWCNAFERRC